MGILVVIGALAAAIVCAIRLRFVLRTMRDAQEAIEMRRPLLIERKDGLWSLFRLDRFLDSVNHLITENIERSRVERGHLDRIQTTLGNLREAVLLINPSRQIVLANNALRELLRTTESPLGRRLESVIQGSEFYDFVREVEGGGQPGYFTLEVLIGRETSWFEVTGSRLPAQKGVEGPLTLFVLHDITKQKRLEMVRTEFVANVSHELRTPVTIIKGFADTLIEDHEELTSEEQMRFLVKIQRNVVRLNQMLEELLILSRLESNPESVKRTRQSLSKVVAETVDNFQMRIDPDLHTLVTEFATEGDVTLLDTLRISQVVDNLLENVLRHARGCQTITVRTRVEAPEIIGEVIDDGPGIPAKDLPHIFERFYRVDKGRSRENGGTGLGLSIVKHIIQQHGGTIEAESKLGVGTTIRFKIPFPEALAERAVLSVFRDPGLGGRARVTPGA